MRIYSPSAGGHISNKAVGYGATLPSSVSAMKTDSQREGACQTVAHSGATIMRRLNFHGRVLAGCCQSPSKRQQQALCDHIEKPPTLAQQNSQALISLIPPWRRPEPCPSGGPR